MSVHIDYEVTGSSGDWVLLVQGHAYARWGWNWQVPALSRSFRVITFDNRGIGRSDAPDPPYTVEEMAADSIGVLDSLGVERVHVVGVSLGGCIALETALSSPGRVNRLVLMATSFGGASERSYPVHERVIRIMTEGASMPPERRMRWGVENALGDHGAARRPELIEAIMRHRLVDAQPVEHWLAQATAYPAYDAAARAGGVKAETLVVTGTDDTVVDPRNSKLLAEEIPGARLVEMSGGHLFFIEHAEEFNPMLERFLRTGDA